MDDPVTPNPYKTLGVPKDAPLATIRSAHRKLVLSCHPDKVQDESAKKAKAEEFHQVQQAYEILSDETRREKYDERARLAELRAKMVEERGPPRQPEYVSPRTTHSPVFEVRGGRIYEERVPKTTRVYADDSFAKFEARPSARKYDEMYGERETTARKTSGRGQEDKRRVREAELEFTRKQKESARKQEEAAIREQKERRRAKDRKKDVEAKTKKKFSYADDPSSDSDTDDRYYSSRRGSTPPPRRYEEVRRREPDPPRRTTVREERDYDGMDHNLSAAREHMSRSREAVQVEVEPRSRPSRPRASSNLDRAPPAPAPPPPARPTEPRKRSSDRERSDKERSGGEKDRRRGRGSRAPSPIRTTSAKKEKYEIVEPAPRKPAMPAASSDPKGLRDYVSSSPRKDGFRTASYQPAQDFKHPGMRRSETMPVPRMRPAAQVPLKSSTLRNAKAPSDMSDSDSDETTDSDVTPMVKSRPSPPRQSTSTKYKVTDRNVVTDRNILVEEPEDMHERVRDDSPRTTRRPERPSMESRTSSMRTPPTRVSSYVDDRPSSRRTESSARMPPLSTQGSGRSKKLFGSVEDFSSHDEAYRSPRSPKVSELDGRGSRGHSRRDSDDLDRDAYPGSLHKSHRRPSYPVY